MKFRAFILALGASVLAAASAQAALVTASDSVTFAFDTSGLGANFTIDGGRYSCTSTCIDNPSASLADGASIGYAFGSTPGASDIAARQWQNGFGFDITNASGGIFGPGGAQPVAGPLAFLYITLMYVDDAFGVDEFSIYVDGARLDGDLLSAEVPIPAAAPLFFAGLAGLGAFRRRKAA